MADIAGQKFGRWTAIKRDHLRPRNWHCRCACGTERSVFSSSLRNGESASCGCARHDRLFACNYRHGFSKTPEYQSWCGMKKRCYNPNTRSFADYGARGITVCDQWRKDFPAFLAEVGPRPSPTHSIGRIDNDRNYEPGNVRWETVVEQANNKRTVARLTTDGVEQSAHVVAQSNGLTGKQYNQRVHRGWPVEMAAHAPSRRTRT